MNVIFLFIIFLVSTSVLLSGLISLIGYILYEEMMSVYSETLVEFSVPCDDLSLSPDEDFETFDIKRNGLKTFVRGDRYMCSYGNVTELVRLVVERQSRLRLAKGLDAYPYLSCGNESLVPKSGHLTVAFSGISQPQRFSDEDSDNVIFHWDTHSSNSHIDPSVSYHNGKITIPEGRTYFIYASVHFNISRQNNTQFQNLQQFSVRICRRVHEYEQTLLGSTKMFNISNANTSLRIASHLKMSRDDKIYIKVSDAKRLIPFSNGNSFGLFPT
ncbi:uncharacterized protein LOC123554553 [Mercenaria mercenaria]|uniref:uncharacterized protein LOC123554553 n=1 Tax=Mercenaria mercenaria TaxID=6596 RepID=UPI001E1DF440|nr:uncharacterized protein LOC123554553 [Mercenaria mercenaria]